MSATLLHPAMKESIAPAAQTAQASQSAQAAQPAQPAQAAQPCAAGAMLLRVVQLLDREGIAYSLLHGYNTYPQSVPSDVDCVMDRKMLNGGLVALLDSHREELQADVVQWFADGAELIVLADRSEPRPNLLQLHVSADYELSNRVLFSGEEILAARQRRGAFCVPPAGLEFAFIAANRVCKLKLRLEHQRRLGELLREDPDGCANQMARVWDSATVEKIIEAMGADGASGESWCAERTLRELRAQLLGKAMRRSPMKLAGRWLAAQGRRLRRWLRPRSGLHLVFLGPDGVGKSTIVEAMQQNWAGAFLRSDYRTFAPGLLRRRRNDLAKEEGSGFRVQVSTASSPNPEPRTLNPSLALSSAPPSRPHAKPPRSQIASLAKAGWWLVYYTLGYFVTIYPTKARAGLVLNHRYLVDALADPRRYRYSGPMWLLRWIWRLAPKPELIVLLDAPAELIQSRKQEVTLEQTAMQREGYLSLQRIATVQTVDASRPIEAVVASVNERIRSMLVSRVRHRLGRRILP